MHARDQMSDTGPHLEQPKITSGALYYLVLMIVVWCSFEYVAPPKSINLTKLDVKDKKVPSLNIGLYQIPELFFSEFGLA